MGVGHQLSLSQLSICLQIGQIKIQILYNNCAKRIDTTCATCYLIYMAYLSTAQKASILAQIETKQTQLDNANETLRKRLDQQVDDYRFDTSEGSQSTKRVKIKELQDVIEALESQIDSLYRKLSSGGLRYLNMRRKGLYQVPGYYQR